uniref:Uncharacterized protein n=1 Tax=Rhizophora mucronata TaxID=61149 RepID=A0A2P2NYU0_RHIMU
MLLLEKKKKKRKSNASFSLVGRAMECEVQ